MRLCLLSPTEEKTGDDTVADVQRMHGKEERLHDFRGRITPSKYRGD